MWLAGNPVETVGAFDVQRVDTNLARQNLELPVMPNARPSLTIGWFILEVARACGVGVDNAEEWLLGIGETPTEIDRFLRSIFESTHKCEVISRVYQRTLSVHLRSNVGGFVSCKKTILACDRFTWMPKDTRRAKAEE